MHPLLDFLGVYLTLVAFALVHELRRRRRLRSKGQFPKVEAFLRKTFPDPPPQYQPLPEEPSWGLYYPPEWRPTSARAHFYTRTKGEKWHSWVSACGRNVIDATAQHDILWVGWPATTTRCEDCQDKMPRPAAVSAVPRPVFVGPPAPPPATDTGSVVINGPLTAVWAWLKHPDFGHGRIMHTPQVHYFERAQGVEGVYWVSRCSAAMCRMEHSQRIQLVEWPTDRNVCEQCFVSVQQAIETIEPPG